MGKGKDGGVEGCILCGAAACCCFVVLIALGLLGLGIAKIVVGVVHLHDCSIEDMIPIWLIVSGCGPLLFGGFGRSKNEDNGEGSNLCGTVCGSVGLLFNLVWLICGSIWIYPNYGTVTADDFVPCAGNITTACTHGDCNKGLITFAFVMVTMDWIFIGLWIALIGFLVYRACKN